MCVGCDLRDERCESDPVKTHLQWPFPCFIYLSLRPFRRAENMTMQRPADEEMNSRRPQCNTIKHEVKIIVESSLVLPWMQPQLNTRTAQRQKQTRSESIGISYLRAQTAAPAWRRSYVLVDGTGIEGTSRSRGSESQHHSSMASQDA